VTPRGPGPRTKRQAPPRLALSVTEASQALGISPDHFNRYVAPDLRWVRTGRKKLVAITEIEAWLERESSLILNGGG
jgi:excisionase family DNA binding protein